MDIAEIGFVADSASVAQATKDLDKLTPATRRAEDAADKANKTFDKSAKSVSRFDNAASGLGGTLNKLKGIVTGLFAAFSIGVLIDITNTWTDLNSRVKIASGSTEAGIAVMERLGDMARRTYSSLTLTAEGYLLNARALKELGYSTNQSLDFVEALNNALVVSGAKGQRAESVINALSKAMSLGKLSGDQLETVLASGGRVTEALAAGLGVATTDLRKMGAEGKLTGDVIYKALTSQFEKLRLEAEGMPATIGDAFVIMGNSITAFVGKLDTAVGVSSAVATGLIFVADNLETVGNVAAVVGAGLVAAFGPTMVYMIGTALVGAFVALGRAIAANPIGFLATALVMVITAVWQFRDAIKQAIGVDVQAIFSAVGNVIIQTFLVAFEQVKYIWETLPNVMGSATISAVNFVIEGLNNMIRASVGAINSLINMIPKELRFGIEGIDGNFGTIAKMTDSFKGAADAGNAAYAASVKLIMATDYVGALASTFEDLTAATGGTVASLDEMSGGGGDGGAAGKAAKALKGVKSAAQEAFEQMAALRKEVMETVGGAFKSFFMDIMHGSSVIDALTSAVGNLADKLMEMVLNQAIMGIIGSLFGASPFGSLGNDIGGGATLGGLQSFLASAKGNAFDYGGVKMFANGGVVGSPTMFQHSAGAGVMGEAGPEAIMPLERGSDGKLGVVAVANDSGNVIFLQPIINNNAADDVAVSTEMGDNGDLIVTIDKIVAERVGDSGSRSSKAIAQSFGLRRATKSRG